MQALIKAFLINVGIALTASAICPNYPPSCALLAEGAGPTHPSNSLVSKKPTIFARGNKDVLFFSVDLPPQMVIDTLENTFKNSAPEIARVYKNLKQQGRVYRNFHVTLMHKSDANASPANMQLWSTYTQMVRAQSNTKAEGTSSRLLGICDVRLKRIVFNDRVMAIVVTLNDWNNQWKSTNAIPHITIGTRDRSVPPKESNTLLPLWAEGEYNHQQDTIREIAIPTSPVIEGEVKAIFAKV